MSFQTLEYALFFPICAIVYFILPRAKENLARNLWLCAASYFFYMRANPVYGVFLFGITIITYGFGLLFDKKPELKGNMAVTWSMTLVTLMPLLLFKYSNFFIRNLNIVTGRVGLGRFNELDLILPVGISFFTFEAVGYMLDVRKGKIPAEKNFLRYMLFIAFFPTVMSGPIERAGHLIPQFKEKHDFDADRVKNGFMLMLWGYFMKLVLSNRVAVFVDKVFNESGSFVGTYSILAVLLYSLQIYFDFASYSYMALGTGEIMGFKLISNFERPYLATSIADFWRRWHISLTSFFRDYVYIPLGGNRKGKLRKYLNILIVFAVSGLWHGASWNFIFWGLLNGLFQVIGDMLKGIREKLGEITGMKKDCFSNRLLKIVCTFILASFAWTFFRAESFMSAVVMLKNCLFYNPWVLYDGSMLNMGLKAFDIFIVMVSLVVVLFVSILNEKGIVIREKVDAQELWFRWLFYIAAIMTVLIFGMYGPSYNSSDFIYFKF